MKKIIFIISILLIAVIASTTLYFRNIVSNDSSSEKVFNIIPTNASLIFEYKNEKYFYEIFKDFTLFSDLLGQEKYAQLKGLENLFVKNDTLYNDLAENEIYFSLHTSDKNNADLLVLIPLKSKKVKNIESFFNKIKTKYIIEENANISNISFSDSSKFYFTNYKNTIVGSFNKNLVDSTINKKDQHQKSAFTKSSLSEQRNKNSIANLYINYPNLHDFLTHFSRRKKPEETYVLKSFPAVSSLNLNFQSNALMFSGITELNDKKTEYASLFLKQNPGKNTLINLIPNDVASYLFFYVSDHKQFKKDLLSLFEQRKETSKRNTQIKEVTNSNSINMEQNLPEVLGNEFGYIQLASGDKLGILSSKKMKNLSLILNSVSSVYSDNIRRLNHSDLFYYFLGDPLKSFKRPYFTIIENHVILANNLGALQRFLKDYENQNFLSRTDRNITFQQYLSNQGNIFYFMHNSNSKSLTRSYLSNSNYKKMQSNSFDWKNIYGLSIQFSADKNKFYTNLYLSKIPTKDEIIPKTDTSSLDSLLNEN